MKKNTKVLFALVIIATFLVSFSQRSAYAAPKRQFVNIGTASIGGGYYPTGGFICNLLNKTRKKYGHNIRCTVESTAGSVANIRSIQNGDLEVGISMSAWQYQSWHGIGQFENDGPNKKLRYLFAVTEDAVHIAARKEARVKSFLDLRNRVVNTGNIGSGTEAQVYEMLKRYNLEAKSFFKLETKLTSKEQAKALCDGKVDAFLWSGFVGNASNVEASNTCGVDIIPWNDGVIKKMLQERTDAITITIPANTYPGQEEEIITWGTPGTVLASEDTPEEVVYYMVKAIFDNFEDFKRQSPMYTNLTREKAATAGRTAPYHSGALRYYKEVGLVK